MKPTEALKEPWIIKDWAGNLMNFGRFSTFEDAEAYLQIHLGDQYELDRQEYEIMEDTKCTEIFQSKKLKMSGKNSK